MIEGSPTEMEVCFNVRELFARALAAPKPQRAVNMSVVMADNRALALDKTNEYWSVASTMNALYALTHGYSFTREETANLTDPDMKSLNWKTRGHPWIKVAVASTLLNKFDFLMMLDSDAFVYQSEVAAEAYLEKWKMLGPNPRKLMVVSHEENPKLWPTGGRFNTGVYIIRNSAKSYAMLKRWASGPEKGVSGNAKGSKGCDPKYLTQWSFDQKPFEACVYNNKQFHSLIQALPSGKPINMPSGEWIKHYPNWSYFLKYRTYSLQHALLVSIYRMERLHWCGTQENSLNCKIPYTN